MRKATKNDMRQKLHHIIFIVMATLLIMGCTGKDSRSLSDVPETMVCTHGDSIALAARFTGDFNHFLAVTDSLADAGELSQIRADCAGKRLFTAISIAVAICFRMATFLEGIGRTTLT